MPLLTDRDAIRAILHTDRYWSAYALGDMAPTFADYATWYGDIYDPNALAMVLRFFDLPIVFFLGRSEAVRRLLDEIGTLPRFFFLVRPDALPVFEEYYQFEKRETMWRMRLEALSQKIGTGAVESLGPGDLQALQRLFADGAEAGQSPDFFAPSMLETGIYYGVREGEALIAAAGTHLFEPSEGIGAIGNVYTRRDRRERGLSTRVTGAVAAELVRRGTPTIVLNVNAENEPAKRVYTRLGFRPYCLFTEGIAIAR